MSGDESDGKNLRKMSLVHFSLCCQHRHASHNVRDSSCYTRPEDGQYRALLSAATSFLQKASLRSSYTERRSSAFHPAGTSHSAPSSTATCLKSAPHLQSHGEADPASNGAPSSLSAGSPVQAPKNSCYPSQVHLGRRDGPGHQWPDMEFHHIRHPATPWTCGCLALQRGRYALHCFSTKKLARMLSSDASCAADGRYPFTLRICAFYTLPTSLHVTFLNALERDEAPSSTCSQSNRSASCSPFPVKALKSQCAGPLRDSIATCLLTSPLAHQRRSAHTH